MKKPIPKMTRQQYTPFGPRLRQLREEAGLTAKAVSALERGERKRPYPHTVRSLALELSEAERTLLTEAIHSRSADAARLGP